MTEDKELRLQKLEAREAKKRTAAKKYFAGRAIREDFYKKYFEKNANQQIKHELENLLAKI